MVIKDEGSPSLPLQLSSALPLHHHPNTNRLLTHNVDVAKPSAISALLMPLGACASSQNNIQNTTGEAQSKENCHLIFKEILHL